MSLRSSKKRFMAVVSFDNYIKGIGHGDILTADTAEEAKDMARTLYSKYSCSVVVKENIADYPNFNWVTVESYKLSK